MRFWSVILVVVVAAILVQAADLRKQQTAAEKIQKILRRVSKNDRTEFLRFHIQKGYDLVKQKMENARYPGFNYRISDEESMMIYEYFVTNNVVEEDDIPDMARTIICWKDKCIDFADPGVHP